MSAEKYFISKFGKQFKTKAYNNFTARKFKIYNYMFAAEIVSDANE